MKRFTIESDDKEFEIAGEVLKWRYPHWTEIVAIFDRDAADLSAAEEQKEFSARRDVEDLIERIAVFIDESDRDRWRELCQRTDNPIPYHQFSDLYRWLLEVGSGRPTEQPSPSASGATTT